jgi:three-Cys-motif partner protein
MPVNQFGVGVGPETEKKEADYSDSITDLLTIGKATLDKAKRSGWAVHPRYLYLEMNAGTGMLDLPDGRRVQGSPLRFLDAARGVGIACDPIFVEIKKKAYAELERNLLAALAIARAHEDPLPRYDLINGDSADVLRELMAHPPAKKPYGLIYCDPNGCEVPFETLAEFSRMPVFERVDILVYVAGGAFKRVATVHDRPRLLEYLSTIRKEHWAIREERGPDQWTFLFGTNWPDLPRKFRRRLSIHDAATETGQAILYRVNTPKREMVS